LAQLQHTTNKEPTLILTTKNPPAVALPSKVFFLPIVMADVETGASSGGLPPEPEMKGALKPIAETTPVERLMMMIAAAAVATSLAAIIIEQSAVVVLAGIFSCAMGPYAYFQQTRLTDIKTLKETHEAVQAEVNRLKESNERLSKNISELSGTVDRLEEVETALDVISNQQGQSVSAFAKQVETNRSLLKQMQGNVKNTVVQNLLSVVFASDTDKDQTVDKEEVDKLIARLQKIGGIEVHDDRFRKAFEGGSFTSLMNVVSNLLKEDLPPEERIFDFDQAPK
jgi:FtsZ-binding cell division protein ZapB